jgi:probable rRNA maturation factor
MSAGPSRSHARRAGTRLNVIVDDPRWRAKKAALPLLRRAARRALAMAPEVRAACELTILLAGDERLQALNAQFRGKDKPTNVLSFPADGAYLGDIALGFDTIAREAREQGKSFAAHAAHLAAHGVLHLIGYDHENRRDAQAMERLETEIMAAIDIADPYAPGGKAA